MTDISLTWQMVLVFGLIGAVVLMFITEWLRVDVVGLLMMVAVPLLGLLDADKALSGLSSNAVISIGAIMVVGAGLDKTGLVSRAIAPVLRLAGKRPSRLISLLASLVALMSAFVQNIGAAALVLPAIQRISRKEDIPASRLLMPIGFAAILGGTLTLVGSSPLILLNDLIAPFGLAGFSLFSVTPIGLGLVVAGILYFVVFGRWVLPGRTKESVHVGCLSPPEPGRHFELNVPADCSPSLNAQLMRDEYQTRLVGLAKANHGGKFMAPDERSAILPGDTMAVVSQDAFLYRLARDYGVWVKPEMEVFARDLSAENWGVVEAVVGPRSDLKGRTLGEVHFRDHFQINVVAIQRGRKTLISSLEQLELKIGDSLVLEGPWDKFRVLAEKRRWLIFCSPVKEEKVPPIKIFWATLWFTLGLTLVLVFGMKLSVGLMTGAVGMVATRVLTIDEAYQSVDWRTIFLLAGLIPLGLATMETGAATWLAQSCLAALGPISGPMLLLVLASLSTALTLVVSNVGAVVLLVPLAVTMAQQSGLDPRLAALTVALATSNSFILPTHQVNALYMGPGRYHTWDFIRAGSVMSLIFLALLLLLIWPLRHFI